MNQERYYLLREMLSEPFLEVDNKGVVAYANDAAQQLFSKNGHGVLGEPVASLLSQSERWFDELLSLHQSANELGVPFSCDYFPRPLTGIFSALSNKEAFFFLFRLESHYTQQSSNADDPVPHLIEEVSQVRTEFEEFAASMSHDLKSPLHQVGSFAQLVQRNYGGLLPEEGQEFLRYIVEGVFKMKTYLKELRELSKISTLSLTVELVSIKDTIEAALRVLQSQITSSRASVSIGSLPVIEGDKRQLQQLFTLLIQNSLKFYDQERPLELTISSRQVAHPIFQQNAWQIDVQDSGIGFEQEKEPLLYKMFLKLDPSVYSEGVGVGLTFAKRIVSRHHGTLSATGERGKGSTFSILLPERQPKQFQPGQSFRHAQGG